MFWSKYNILSKSNKYGYLLFNTMSLAFIRILENDINTWLELKENPDSYKDFSNSNFLLKARIIVENQEDDLNVYLADILKNRYNSSDMALTILPTRGCNFGCIYCYEQDRPNIAMSEQTEDAIVRFVKSNSNLKRLSVVWYGGEPLLNFDSIISPTISQTAAETTAMAITTGTNTPATLSARRAMGALLAAASSTRRIMPERVVSSPTRSAAKYMLPAPFMVP